MTGRVTRKRVFCHICGRRMVWPRTLAAKLMPGRIDCGGDCWRCVQRLERSFGWKP